MHKMWCVLLLICRVEEIDRGNDICSKYMLCILYKDKIPTIYMANENDRSKLADDPNSPRVLLYKDIN